jgi:hypothetical protein
MVFEGFALLKTKLPATKTSAPKSVNFLALEAVTPPSTSIVTVAFFFLELVL